MPMLVALATIGDFATSTHGVNKTDVDTVASLRLAATALTKKVLGD